jgi:hypothetical protein
LTGNRQFFFAAHDRPNGEPAAKRWTGPGQFFFDLNITREFRLNEHLRLRPLVEFDNVLNKTVYSFGSEFINFNAFAPAATPEQRQAFLDSFLVTTRTLRPRQVRLGIRFDF